MTGMPGQGLQNRRWRLLTAFVLGALATIGFAPFYFLPVCFVSFSGLLYLLNRCSSPGAAFWTGWFFAWGHFIAGLYWIASAFLVEPEKFAWMIPIPTLGLPALLALFPAVATLVAWRVAPAGPWRLAALAAAWGLMEMARGRVLTGFPWNSLGYVTGGLNDVMQLAAWLGVYGISVVALAVFAAPALLSGPRRHWRFILGVWGLAALAVFIVSLRIPSGPLSPLKAEIAIIQANIPQKEKWRPDRVFDNFRTLIDMSTEAARAGADVIIWPETAATFHLENEPEVRRIMGQALARDGKPAALMITGAPSVRRIDGLEHGFNSAHVLSGDGAILDTVDKHHLVPLGEYLPFRSLLARIGMDKIAAGKRDFTAGVAAQNLALPGLPDAALLICYEAIFPDEVLRNDRPGWIINLTNDAWFGHLTGPNQHFAMARFRAIEQGLPLVRAAGTGISAIVDPYGRVTARLDLGQRGVLQGQVPVAAAPTRFSRNGSLPILVFCLSVLGVIGIFRTAGAGYLR